MGFGLDSNSIDLTFQPRMNRVGFHGPPIETAKELENLFSDVCSST